MKKCMTCGETAMVSKRESHKFGDLPGVTLQNVEVLQCGKCGEREVVIPKMEQLIRVLAVKLIEQQRRLSGVEIRFLRKSLGWSGADFAKHIGARAETVSKWENDKEPIGPQSDRLLRLMVAHETPLDDYSLDSLVKIDAKPKPMRVKLKAGADGWQEAA